jgi:hypothetical protein
MTNTGEVRGPQAGRTVASDVEDLKRDFRNLTAKTTDAVTQEVEEHPLRSLMVALGIGFIGGLFARR